MSKQDAAAKHWCFTCNNPSITKEDLLEALKPFITYGVLGDEVGASGTPHIQGYLVLTNKLRLVPLKKLFGTEAVPHLEKRSVRSSPKQASDYCKKDGKFIEYGTLDKPKAKACRLKALTDSVIAGNNTKITAMLDPPTYVRNYRGLATLERLIDQPPEWRDLKVYLLYGETGGGKTHYAMNFGKQFDPPEPTFKKPIGKGLWFDGYKAQSIVLIDEFHGDIPLNHMLQIMDKWQCQVEIKGGHEFLKNTHLFITTNQHPGTFYENWKNREKEKKAFARRIAKLLWFKTAWTPMDDPEVEEFVLTEDIYGFLDNIPIV